MWLSVMALLLAADPGPDSADAVFKRMEQSILKCKTFKTEMEIAAGPGKSNLDGRLLVAQGNKMRLELGGSFKGQPIKMLTVSNGAKMRATVSGQDGQDQEAPKQFSEIALASVTRTGFFIPMMMISIGPEKPGPLDLDKQFSISDIKLGNKEKVSGKQAQVLDYKLTIVGMKEPLTMTVWIDVKTNLPLKRVITVKGGKEKITETYTNAALDDKIDDKEFKLSKKQ